jgi:hypothetical protein
VDEDNQIETVDTLSIDMGATEETSTTEISEVSCHTTDEMDMAETILANLKTKGGGHNNQRGNQFHNQNRGENHSNHYKHQPLQTAAPQRGSYNGGRGAMSGQTGKWCASCKKPTHNTKQC